MSDDNDAVLARLAAMQEVVTFMYGVGELEGRDFGAPAPVVAGIRRPYWWRQTMCERMADLTAAIESDRRATPASDEAVGDDDALWKLAEDALDDALEYGEHRYDNTGKNELARYRESFHASRDKLRAALSARTAAPAEQGVVGWRTMDSAPRDGTRILIRADATFVAGWTEGGSPDGKSWVIVNDCWFPDHMATGWLPLPAPIAPDARSVDGLSGEDAKLLRALVPAVDAYEAHEPTKAEQLRAAIRRRLAGAKAQSENTTRESK